MLKKAYITVFLDYFSKYLGKGLHSKDHLVIIALAILFDKTLQVTSNVKVFVLMHEQE